MLTPVAIVITVLVAARLLKRRRVLRPRRHSTALLVGPRFLAPARPTSYTTWPTFTQPPIDPAEEALARLRAYDATLAARIADLRQEEATLRSTLNRLGVVDRVV